MATSRESISNGSDAESNPSKVARDRPLGLIAEAILDDHAELSAAIARLGRLCLPPIAPSTEVPPEPLKLLKEFEDLLLLHFAAEEAEEFLGRLTTDEPKLLERIDRLQDEHGTIIEALDRVIELAPSGSGAAPFRGALEDLFSRLDAHERAESCLMQELIVLSEGPEA